MEQKQRKRNSILNKLNIFDEYVKQCQEILKTRPPLTEQEIIQFKDRLTNLEYLNSEFDVIQSEIEEEIPVVELPLQYEKRRKFSNNFYNSLSNAKFILKQHDERSSETDGQSAISSIRQDFNIKLPQIQLPKFVDDSESWLEFRDTYLSLIHENSSLTSIQKFHCLRASLIGKAADGIKNLTFSAENYVTAWDALCDRYNDKRMLIFNHIQALFALESIHKESSVKIRRLLDTSTKNLRSLKSLLSDDNLLEAFLIFLLTSKLDPVTNREWEEKQTDNDTIQFSELTEFLKSKASLLEKIESKRQKSPERQQKHFKNITSLKSFFSVKTFMYLLQ